MQITVLGWSYKNIRGGLRDVTIDLVRGNDRWTLIQMPNGTGKTTTMTLLRAAFTGEMLSPQAVRDLRAADDTVEGQFELRLLVDQKPFRIQLRLNFRDGLASYRTARSVERSGGLEEGHLLPAELQRLLTPEFSRLFVFDGELAKEIRAVGKDRAATAIRTLYRIDRIEHINSTIRRLVEEEQRRAAAVSSAKEQKGITRLRNAYDAAFATHARLLQDEKRIGSEIKKKEGRLADLRLKINERIAQDSTLRDKKESLDLARQIIDAAIFNFTAQGMSVLRSPAKVHGRTLNRLHALGERLTQLKLPKTTSKEFFRELAEQADCICGRPVTPEIREAILARSEIYLAEDQVAVINKMKLAVREISAEATEWTAIINQLGGYIRDRTLNKHAHDQLELERVESGDVELQSLREEVTGTSRDLMQLRDDLEKLTTRDAARQLVLGANETNNLPKCDAEMKLCKKRLDTATDTHRFVQKADLLQSLILETAETALERLRERVRHATNEKLQRLIPSEAIRVAKISGSLELESGRTAVKAGVSEGQSLSVAYAFLTSLLSEATYKLPFIVDSPAVSLDVAVRREVGELIPEMFDQMIMFVISSEREGFADSFYGRRQVRYITLWRDYDDSANVKDGMAFFKSFHQVEA